MLRTYEVVFLADGTNTLLWDPSDETTPQFTLLDGPTTGLTANLLCGGHAFLSDGHLLTVGGGGFGPGAPTSNQAWKLDPVARTWKQVGNMATQRWYPTVLTLGDETGPTGKSGRSLVAGGQGAGGPTMEAYSEVAETFTTIVQNGPTTKTFTQTYPASRSFPAARCSTRPPALGTAARGAWRR